MISLAFLQEAASGPVETEPKVCHILWSRHSDLSSQAELKVSFTHVTGLNVIDRCLKITSSNLREYMKVRTTRSIIWPPMHLYQIPVGAIELPTHDVKWRCCT